MKLTAFTLSILIGLGAFAASAFAETPAERGHAKFERASARFELQEYREAIVLYKEAYEDLPDPRILFNIAQAYRQIPDYDDAIEYYHAYLRVVPDADNRPIVEARIKEMQDLKAKAAINKANPPDGTEKVPAPVPAPVPTPAPPPPPIHHDHGTSWVSDGWGWTLVGGGVLLAGGGAAFLIHASSQKGDLSATPEAMRDGLQSSISRNQTIGAVGLIAGGACIISGIVKFALDAGGSSETHESASAGLDFAIGPGSLVVAGTF